MKRQQERKNSGAIAPEQEAGQTSGEPHLPFHHPHPHPDQHNNEHTWQPSEIMGACDHDCAGNHMTFPCYEGPLNPTDPNSEFG